MSGIKGQTGWGPQRCNKTQTDTLASLALAVGSDEILCYCARAAFYAWLSIFVLYFQSSCWIHIESLFGRNCCAVRRRPGSPIGEHGMVCFLLPVAMLTPGETLAVLAGCVSSLQLLTAASQPTDCSYLPFSHCCLAVGREQANPESSLSLRLPSSVALTRCNKSHLSQLSRCIQGTILRGTLSSSDTSWLSSSIQTLPPSWIEIEISHGPGSR